MLKKIIRTDDSKTTIIIRFMVGIVFLSEGIQKFILPLTRGAGRFENIGFAHPDFFASFVGTFEILCGILILIGLATRLAGLITFIIISVAIATTKVEIFAQDSFWQMMHASRTDMSMFLGSLFLIFKGAGCWSIDKMLMKPQT